MLALGGGLVAVICGLIVWSISSEGAGVVPFAVALGVGVAAAWMFGYPRRATAPAIATVVLIAIAVLPHVFGIEGVFLQEADGVPQSRLVLVAGLYAGGLGLLVLGFVIAGFVGPLIGAVRAWRRGLVGGAEVCALHLMLVALGLGAIFIGRALPVSMG